MTINQNKPGYIAWYIIVKLYSVKDRLCTNYLKFNSSLESRNRKNNGVIIFKDLRQNNKQLYYHLRL